MSDVPWLTIIGIGENGVEGLTPASQAALDAAQVIMGPPRHLALVPTGNARRIEWPVPFADGLPLLKDLQGEQVVVLASGDPFWFGAGSVIARHFEPKDWTALPSPSCFALTAARLGWAIDDTVCLGLHAAPLQRLRRHLAAGVRIIVTLRDGDAVSELAGYLCEQGFEASILHILEHLGGPLERITELPANKIAGSFESPVCVAIHVAGPGAVLPVSSGLPDETFAHDGQITKRPVRAITLSTLAPKPDEHLWDIGGGSGSIALEWVLAHPTTVATCIEPRSDRAARVWQNAEDLGVAHRVTVVEGSAPDALSHLKAPNAVFVGGGLSDDVLTAVTKSQSARIVVNAVTLEGEALLAKWHAQLGGELMRIALSSVTPIGPKRGWCSSYPVVQWSLVR